MSVPDACIHCNLPIPPADLVIDWIDGRELHFCCNGCRGVYRIISGAGLHNFYERRDWSEAGVPPGVFETRFEETQLAGHVIIHDAENAEMSLIIEGIRCASCVWLLEKLLDREPGIIAVRVNYGTHRARLRFNPSLTSPGKILAGISRLGYLPHPFTAGAAQQAAAREQRTLLIRFGTAAFLAMQLMGFSLALYGGYFHGIDPGMRRLIQYLAAIVTTPVVFYSGWPFLAGAWRSLANRAPSMDLLISLGVLTAYSYSIVMLVTGGEVYFDSAAMIVTLILLGRLLEGAARTRAISGIDKLMQLAPDMATRLSGEEQQVVASAALLPGDAILVRPGERIPVDCRICDGVTELDESTISGESMPVLRRPGDTVAAGTLNLTASIKLIVDRVAAESFIARMARLVEEAQNRQAPIQSLADRVASLFVPAVILVAVATWVFWTISQAPQAEALLNAVAVLIVACPCALGLATPTAVLVASGCAATRGILFRGGDILEMAAHIDLVAFDKTGTLTLGRPTVSEILAAPGRTDSDILRLAGQVESGSNHPLARGILDRAKAEGIVPSAAASVTAVPGRGLRMTSPDGEVLVGSRTFLTENEIDVPSVASDSATEVHVSLAGVWQGVLLVQDHLRGDADEVVAKLQASGLDTVLLTGDRARAAEATGARLQLSQGFLAGLSPADKAAWIRERQAAGKRIMMVGDGINDAPALSQADIGCAMAGGTDIALETSDLVLTRPALARLYEAILIARMALLSIKQNLFWAFSYNLVTIPLAASGLLAPVWAAVAMAASSVLVVGNSLYLGRRVRLTFSVARRPSNN